MTEEHADRMRELAHDLELMAEEALTIAEDLRQAARQRLPGGAPGDEVRDRATVLG